MERLAPVWIAYREAAGNRPEGGGQSRSRRVRRRRETFETMIRMVPERHLRHPYERTRTIVAIGSIDVARSSNAPCSVGRHTVRAMAERDAGRSTRRRPENNRRNQFSSECIRIVEPPSGAVSVKTMNSMARRMFELVEPIGVIPYSADEPNEAMFALGFTNYWDTYFAGRAAPLGLVPAEVVDALFYNFAPGEVARHIPKVWRTTTPEAALAARQRGCVKALRRILGDASTLPPSPAPPSC